MNTVSCKHEYSVLRVYYSAILLGPSINQASISIMDPLATAMAAALATQAVGHPPLAILGDAPVVGAAATVGRVPADGGPPLADGGPPLADGGPSGRTSCLKLTCSLTRSLPYDCQYAHSLYV